MIPLDAPMPEAHIFVCTNERPEPKAACDRVGGKDFYLKLKARLKESPYVKTHFASRAGCLGYCNLVGCTVAVYFKNKPALWFREVKEDDFEKIWEVFTQTSP